MGTASLRHLLSMNQSGRVSVSGWRPVPISCPLPWFVDPSGVLQGITANLAVYCEMEHLARRKGSEGERTPEAFRRPGRGFSGK